MYTAAALLDVHERTHRSLQGVLDHLATLPAQDLARPHEGFSYPTLLARVHHVLGAERYWIGVLQGVLRVDDDADARQTVEALRGLRADVAGATARYLRSLPDHAASVTRSVTQWNGKTVDVVPAHVLLRTQTHAYQHQGEIASMIRRLGHAFPAGLDFPLR